VLDAIELLIAYGTATALPRLLRLFAPA